MNGRAFLDFARELASNEEEGRRRTAVSRAYYGAYHITRELVRNCGVIVPKHDVHVKLQWCLQQIGERVDRKNLTNAGRKLGDLRTERNKADYDLDDGAIAKPANVIKAIRHAERIVDAISSFSIDGASDPIREHVRGFAQQQGWQLR